MNIRVTYLDRDGVERTEVRRGLTAGTFQHEVDHLDGILFVDRADPRTLSTWEQYERFGREEFERRARELVERVGARDRRYWCELAWLGGERAEAGRRGRGRRRADRRGRAPASRRPARRRRGSTG